MAFSHSHSIRCNTIRLCKFIEIQNILHANMIQVIKTFSIREGTCRWYIGIKGDGCVKSKGTRFKRKMK